MAKKPINTVQLLEKNLAQLTQQLIKAHSKKIADLEKAIVTTAATLKKNQLKLKALNGKTTPAAIRQKDALTESNHALKTTGTSLKTLLADAKNALTNTLLLQKAEQDAIAQNIQTKSDKKTLKKKAIKKTLKKTEKALTPDLTKPVKEITEAQKPQKIWNPKQEEMIGSIGVETPPIATPISTPAVESLTKKPGIEHENTVITNWHTIPIIKSEE